MCSPIVRPHRLEAKDIALSRRKPGFESRWGHSLEAGFQAGFFHILTPDKLSTKSGLTRQEYECVGVRILFKRPTLHVAYPEGLSPRPPRSGNGTSTPHRSSPSGPARRPPGISSFGRRKTLPLPLGLELHQLLLRVLQPALDLQVDLVPDLLQTRPFPARKALTQPPGGLWRTLKFRLGSASGKYSFAPPVTPTAA